MSERTFFWDFFIAHSSQDNDVALALYEKLISHSKPFLDLANLEDGDDWITEIPKAQANSRVSVILVSSKLDSSYYQKTEVAAAIDLSRNKEIEHRVIPIFLDEAVAKSPTTTTYGLGLKQGQILSAENTLEDIANALLNRLRKNVVLSYNHADKAVAETISERLSGELQAHNLQITHDAWEYLPDFIKPQEFDRLTARSNAFVFFSSPNDLGIWKKNEVQSMLEKLVLQNLPVVSVTLPGSQSVGNNTFPFLQEEVCIDFSENLEDRALLSRLLWSITYNQVFPRQNAPDVIEDYKGSEQDQHEKEVQAAAKKLCDRYRRGKSPTFFLGTGAALVEEEYDPHLPPRAGELTRELFLDLELVHPDKDVNILASTDTAGLYYASKKDDFLLEERVKELITDRSKKIPPTYISLVRLLGLLQIKNFKVRGGVQTKHLIITTNFDLLLECALLRAKLRFTRIVVHRSGKMLSVNEFTESLPNPYKKADLDEIPARLQEKVAADEISKLIQGHQAGNEPKIFITDGTPRRDELRISSLDIDRINDKESPNIVLFKFHGSLDIERSCAITTDHYFRLQKSAVIPKQIDQHLSINPSVFLGYGPLDPDLHLTYYMLRDELKDDDQAARYSVPLRPNGKEKSLWGDIRTKQFLDWGMKALDIESENFLGRIIEMIESK